MGRSYASSPTPAISEPILQVRVQLQPFVEQFLDTSITAVAGRVDEPLGNHIVLAGGPIDAIATRLRLHRLGYEVREIGVAGEPPHRLLAELSEGLPRFQSLER